MQWTHSCSHASVRISNVQSQLVSVVSNQQQGISAAVGKTGQRGAKANAGGTPGVTPRPF